MIAEAFHPSLHRAYRVRDCESPASAVSDASPRRCSQALYPAYTPPAAYGFSEADAISDHFGWFRRLVADHNRPSSLLQ